MPPKRHPPESPKEWLNRARSDLALARAEGQEVYFEDLSFHAQQATEKAIKALLIAHGVEFPYTHDIAVLLTLLEGSGIHVPVGVREAERLTRFATLTRYPGVARPVAYDEYREALVVAEEVVQWVETAIESGKP